MKENRLLNTSYKYCKFCNRTMFANEPSEACPYCLENELFQNVKDFIRANDVNEHQVAIQFNIPVSQVKQWIKEGRIEYKESGSQFINSVHCQCCGAPVSFGTLCLKCLRTVSKTMHGSYSTDITTETARMRFLELNDKTESGKLK